MNWKDKIRKEDKKIDIESLFGDEPKKDKEVDEGYIAQLKEDIEMGLMYITKEESLEEIRILVEDLRGEE